MIPKEQSSGFSLGDQENLRVLDPLPQSHRVTRREMVQRLLGGLGAAFALPGVMLGHPIRKHLADAAFLAQADANASAPDWKPEIFNSHQNDLFTALSERIVPGSAQAQVDRTVDLLLTVDTDENRKALFNALAAIDAESQHRFGGVFTAATAAQQNDLLATASTGKKSESESAPALRDHFENLKGWIVGAYYSSEIGMRELGWTDDYYFEWTGCEHDYGHE
jgi:Gluconate 2-dehydrogenase subunit 3